MHTKNNLSFEAQISVLIVDDDSLSRDSTRLMCKMLLKEIANEEKEKVRDLKIVDVDSIEKAINELAQSRYHIVFLDKDLGKRQDGTIINGIDHIPELLAVQPFSQILVFTGDLSFKDITRAIKTGATDYLIKSEAKDFAEYRDTVVRRAIKKSKEELSHAQKENNKKTGLYSNYVCASPAMQRFEQKLWAMAESSRPVLLLGATGLGKGAAARRISEMRAKILGQKYRPLIQENIGGIVDNLAQGILFGTEPGAYTDVAKRTSPGLLDLANDGDIFLDEIGDISKDLQKKLLKVVEEKQYYRVGGKVPITTTARFIFATNKNMKDLVEKEIFREDLYMRIAAFEEQMPALEERKADLPGIINGFIQAALLDYKNKKVTYESLPQDLIKYLTRDEIPGNIRGIENDITRLVAHATTDEKGYANFKEWRKILGLEVGAIAKKGQDSILELKHLEMLDSNFLNKDFPGFKLAKTLFERKLFEEVSKKCRTIPEAAKILKLSNGAISGKMKEYKLKFERGTYGQAKR